MIDPIALEDELREAIYQFLVPLRTGKIVDNSAFEKMEHIAITISIELKGRDMLPKSILKELYVVAGVIRAEAPYVSRESENLDKMANRIQMIFDLIIFDESTDERKPGIPRVR